MVSESLDFGCGKLRYCERTEALTIVDSEIQLSRTQLLNGAKSNIREVISYSNRIRAYNDIEFQKSEEECDRAFCINVLSVIPLIGRRRCVVETIRARLRPRGECLYVVPNARPWRDGFLIDSLRGFSFYGLISPDGLISLLQHSGYSISDVRRDDGSVYVWAGRA
jgi:hypothetical protein